MVRANISRIKGEISRLCAQIKRDPAGITLIAVSKGRTVEQVKEAVDAGATDIGENRVQEALLKYNALRQTQYAERIKWHLIGHLQSNKAKEAVKFAELIHSVDSLRLAQEIDKQAAKINKLQDILLEVKTSPEETKLGLSPEDCIGVIKEAGALKNIRIQGLMTIAPLVGSPEAARPYFKQLKDLLDSLNALRSTPYALRILSMGMTNDFTVAIEEGSTMVRVGRAIFD
ncbi:MAG: YggS family pyridoxal phosphate-dependent enzyme [Candidatus Omnitrophica bacterium]|nr:YggS family pyridoxal phosphate-dependent enzyme [Candidatus Omnitrophota bacterium]MDD5653054.1 YggS family pyridoxal phosphate-dependent enzyme [Candidatus Omnitrophota bacterium]